MKQKQSKWCPHCKQDVPLEGWSKNKGRADGLQSWCKVCLCDPEFRERQLEQRKERHVTNRLRALSIVSASQVCTWSHLGGCDGDLEIDHIVPVLRRTKKGYASHGHSLVSWILNNPTHPKLKGLQLLCNEHNRFKGDLPEIEAKIRWMYVMSKRDKVA